MSIADWTLTVNCDVIDVPPFDGLLALTSAPTDSPRWPRCRPGVARYTLAFTGHDGWAETWSVTRATAVAVHRAAATSADYPTGEQVYAMLSTAPAESPEWLADVVVNVYKDRVIAYRNADMAERAAGPSVLLGTARLDESSWVQA